MFLITNYHSCEVVYYVLLSRGVAMFYMGIPVLHMVLGLHVLYMLSAVLMGFSGSSLGHMNHDCRIACFLEGKAHGEHIAFL